MKHNAAPVEPAKTEKSTLVVAIGETLFKIEDRMTEILMATAQSIRNHDAGGFATQCESLSPGEAAYVSETLAKSLSLPPHIALAGVKRCCLPLMRKLAAEAELSLIVAQAKYDGTDWAKSHAEPQPDPNEPGSPPDGKPEDPVTSEPPADGTPPA